MKRNLEHINDLVNTIEYKTQLIGRDARLNSGIRATYIMGIIIGFIVTWIIIAVPILYYKGGI